MQPFIADLLERSWKTFIQAFIATFGLVFVAPTNVTDLNAWKAAAVAALVAAVSAAISAVTSMLSRRVGDPNSASLVVADARALVPGPVALPPAVPLEVAPVTVNTDGLPPLTFAKDA